MCVDLHTYLCVCSNSARVRICGHLYSCLCIIKSSIKQDFCNNFFALIHLPDLPSSSSLFYQAYIFFEGERTELQKAERKGRWQCQGVDRREKMRETEERVMIVEVLLARRGTEQGRRVVRVIGVESPSSHIFPPLSTSSRHSLCIPATHTYTPNSTINGSGLIKVAESVFQTHIHRQTTHPLNNKRQASSVPAVTVTTSLTTFWNINNLIMI